mgnify:CR=1 FL=1
MGISLQKQKRIKNTALIKQIKEREVCVVCLKTPVDLDHITTVGAGGGDTYSNLMPLCRLDHSTRHSKGIKHMIEKYPRYKDWLIRNERFDVFEKLGIDVNRPENKAPETGEIMRDEAAF